MDISEMYEKIREFDWVSFDVFDTLLLRPYVKPENLFKHMEANENIPGFSKARIIAEKRARTKERPEVTIKDIYDKIDSEFESFMDLEMRYESVVLQQNPEMKTLFDMVVSDGKKVVLLSDMYLPSLFVDEVLKKKGFSGYEKLYVSGEYGKSKHFGDLFEHVLDDLKIERNGFVHVGDNKVSDIRTPERLGLATVWYEKPIDKYFKTHKREYRYYLRKRNLERSLIVGIDSLYRLNSDSEKNFWYDFGFKYGGPVATAFASFIDRNTKESDVLLFIARDGYNAQKAYNILYGNVENHYVYAVRLFNIFFGITGKDYPGYEKEIIQYFSDREETENFVGTPEEILSENFELYQSLMDEELKRYGEYLNEFLEDKENACMVDVSTMKFSAQRLIENTSGKNIKGIYYTLMDSFSDDKAVGFVDNYYAFLEYTLIDVPEFLMTSGESSIIKLDKKGLPVYSGTPIQEEWYRGNVTSEIEKGIADYAFFIKNVFGDLLPHFESNSVNKWILSLARKMNPEERSSLGKIKWASDPAHSEYHKLIFSPSDSPKLMQYKFRDYCRSLMRRIKE